MNNTLTKLFAIVATAMLGAIIFLLFLIRSDLKRSNSGMELAKHKIQKWDDFPFSIESLDKSLEGDMFALSRLRDWIAFDNFIYYPARDTNLTEVRAREIIQLINTDELKARELLSLQVSQDERNKYDTVKTDVLLTFDTEYLNIRAWINGFDTRIIGKSITLKNVPLRPENIHLVIMVQDPDEAKLTGSIKINGKEAKFEFKEMDAIDLVSKSFKFKEFSIQECKYIPPCPSNPV